MKQEKIVFLKGKKVVLRPPRKSTDLELCMKWINDPEVRAFLAARFPMNEEKESQWFDAQSDTSTKITFIIELHDGTPIGVIGMHGIDWISGTATTGTVIGEPEHWGKGYGTDAKMLLLKYAFIELNLRKIKSTVLAFNARSQQYSKKCGYRTEGRLKQEFFRNGDFHDMILLAVFKEDWLPLWEKYQSE